jgi:uncharacterized membrane protein HdeD (DUF308 family)
MPKIAALFALIAGAGLLIYGLDASSAVASAASHIVSTTPSSKAIWMLALGVVGVIAGGCGLVFGPSRNPAP